MANASVDKLKALGLRHGEKAVMGLTAALCLFLLYSAATRETISLTPEQVKQAASSAESNLSRNQPPEDILSLLEKEGVKNPGFETIVEQQQKNLLVADNYRPHQLWVSPEPGAGLIRDMPGLIAPTDLLAYPGRGGILVFELDENGNRIPDPDAAKVQDPETVARRSRKGPALGARSARAKMGQARKKEEAEKERLAEENRKKAAVAGKIPAKAEEATADASATPAVMKEITRGVRWVAITGVLDYKTLRDNYLTALKKPEIAYPHFKQLEVERQAKQSDGSWSDWTPIDLEQNRRILDNLPEEDEEWTPENVRLSALVAPLPFLKPGHGFWQGVHVARMVPKEKLQVAAAPQPGYAGAGYDSSSGPPGGSMMPDPSSMAMEGSGSGGGYSSGSGSGSGGGYSSGSGSGMSGDAMYGGGAVESMDFPKAEGVDEVMIRALDFTVDQDTTYRFRVRIVVYNPNRGREDVSPGVDTKSIELFGPWSESTDEVTMPSDVATYAIAKDPNVPRKLEQVKFEVACWIPENGVTVVKPFSASPGEIIGEVKSADLPILDTSGKKPQSMRVNFNSHQLVLDVMGGNLPMPVPPLGPNLGSQFVAPGMAFVVRRDGSVAVRSQASDVSDQVRKDIVDNYIRTLKDLEKKRPAAPMSSGYGSSSS